MAHMAATFDYAVIGGGIVGLSTALAISSREPSARMVVLGKETALAQHQTGRNSGVIHSSIYYKPGSLKAKLCRRGLEMLSQFCEARSIPYSICGKLIVATTREELQLLEGLAVRGRENGLTVSRLCPEEARVWEPGVQCVGALRVAETGVVDYGLVCREIGSLLRKRGCAIRTGSRATGIRATAAHVELVTHGGAVQARLAINCAGLQSDRIARLAGLTRPRIVPFRGQYYTVTAPSEAEVRGLIYPVPNPAYPFLGVHLTRGIEGHVHAGPNAVLALSREGYQRWRISLPDLWSTLSYPGFWRLAARSGAEGWRKLARSFSRRLFARSVQRPVPALREQDLAPAPAGIRAQAIDATGRLVDDFLILQALRTIHVLNAPSPAATAGLAIGEYMASTLLSQPPQCSRSDSA